MLVADYFVTGEGDGPLTLSGHRLDTFLQWVDSYGFTVERREDVTARVTRTLDFANEFFEDRVYPAYRILAETWGAEHPHVLRLLGSLLRKPLKELEHLRVQIDSSEFSRMKRYMFFLFRVPEA